mmetsp:Transcript_44195/g.116842  ORF Transcript_44195/g.116842 Transcript_44195/m.116842 type:complete len:569 (-) Transcript_44195:218-1924(-)
MRTICVLASLALSFTLRRERITGHGEEGLHHGMHFTHVAEEGEEHLASVDAEVAELRAQTGEQHREIERLEQLLARQLPGSVDEVEKAVRSTTEGPKRSEERRPPQQPTGPQGPPPRSDAIRGAQSNQGELDGMVDEVFRNYNRNTRPVPDSNHKIQVRMGLNFQKIVKLDQTSGFLTMVVWFRLQWPDFRLAYDSTDLQEKFGWNSSSDFMAIDMEKIWVPDIYLLNSVDRIKFLSGTTRAYWYDAFKLHEDGYNVLLNRPALIKTRCDVNMTQYPFDVQECLLRWGAWSASNMFFDFSTLDHNLMMTGNLPDTTEEFNVTNIRAESSDFKFKVAEGAAFPQVVYVIQLQRYGFWYMVVIVYPLIFLVLVAASVFFLDIRSGERHGVTVTLVLTTMAVGFLTAERLPKSADDMWLVRFQSGVYAFIVVPVIVSCVVDYVDVYYNRESVAPYVIDTFFQVVYPWAVLFFLIHMFEQIPFFDMQRSTLCMAAVIVVFFFVTICLSVHSLLTYRTSPHFQSHKRKEVNGLAAVLAKGLNLAARDKSESGSLPSSPQVRSRDVPASLSGNL